MATSASAEPAATPRYTKPTFLMCPPTLYNVDYVINPWMAGNLHRSSKEQAMKQWQGLYDALSSVADVELIEPQPGSPDMVFTAGAGLVMHGVAMLSSFAHKERRGEEQHFRRWFLQQGFLVLDTRRETPFEGEGDVLFEADGSRIWAGHGMRTCATSHAAVQTAWGKPVLALKLQDPRFYSLHTCFAPLTGGYVMYYPGAFDEESRQRIESAYPVEKRIGLSEADAVRFACDAVNVGKTILMPEASVELAERLQKKGFDVVQLPLGEFLKGGGGAKCLTLRLSDMNVTHI